MALNAGFAAEKSRRAAGVPLVPLRRIILRLENVVDMYKNTGLEFPAITNRIENLIVEAR